MVTKVNPVFDNSNARSFVGKSVSVFTITTTSRNVSASTAPDEAIDAILKTVGLSATIVAHSTFTDATPSVATVWLEGEFPTDTYDGTNSETFAAHLEDTLQALGTVDSLDLSATAVAAGTVYKADQV